jgi:Flp pilus assembly protein TadD
VELKPDYAWAVSRRALVHLALGDTERALADADRAKELRPEDASVLASRGSVLAALGRRDEGCAESPE